MPAVLPVGVLVCVWVVVAVGVGGGVFWALVVLEVVAAEDFTQFPLLSVYPETHCLHCPAVSWKLGLQTKQR